MTNPFSRLVFYDRNKSVEKIVEGSLNLRLGDTLDYESEGTFSSSSEIRSGSYRIVKINQKFTDTYSISRDSFETAYHLKRKWIQFQRKPRQPKSLLQRVKVAFSHNY